MKQKDSKNLFKLKKFQAVGPRTNTYSRQGIFSEKSQLVNQKEQTPEIHEELIKSEDKEKKPE